MEFLSDGKAPVQAAITEENLPTSPHRDGTDQNIDRAGLDALTSAFVVHARRVGGGWWGIHLFDSAAGGSGHIASSLRDQTLWFSNALELLRGNGDHGRRCRDACLACILDAQSQADFEKGKLNRLITLEFLYSAGKH